MSVVFRPLGIAKDIVEEMGLTISFEYDDLVFIESNAFLVQFDEDNTKNLKLYINKEMATPKKEKLFNDFQRGCAAREFEATYIGAFEIREKEGAESELEILTYPVVEA